MRIIGMRTVIVTDLDTNLFVRKELDQDHVLYLAELIENGVKMKDSIEVTMDGDKLIVVDGRHRKEAYELNRVDQIQVKMLEFVSQTEMIAYAYKANTGHSKPPTLADTEHTVMLLLEQGEAVKDIAKLLRLPPSMARRFIGEVKSKATRAKVMRAVEAVADGGLTAAKAAEAQGVDVDHVRKALSGGRRKHKQGVAEVQRNLTRSYRSISSKNAALMRSIFEKFEDGDVTAKQCVEIFDHIESLQKRSERAISDWRKRFNGLGKIAKP